MLRSRALALDLDTRAALVTGTVTLPLTSPEWLYGLVVNSAGHVFMSQGNQVLEATETDLSQSVAHDTPMDVGSMPGLRLSSDERLLYAVSRPPTSANNSTLLVAIDTSTFQVVARQPLPDVPHSYRPYELPDKSKLYVVGGEPAGPVTLDVFETVTHTALKRITFDQPRLLGASAGESDPFAYAADTHTLYVGATHVVLAIDTQTDTIKQVIRLDDMPKAIGLDPNQLTYTIAGALVYSPAERYLYIAHIDMSYISVYDVTTGRFLPFMIPVNGLFPTYLFPNADYSRLYAMNTLSDNITVIDTASKSVEKVIDLHDSVPVPSPGAPFVATQPTNCTVAVGATATFRSMGNNPRPTTVGPAIQWQVRTSGGSAWSNIPGATTSAYSFVPALADSGS